MGEVSSREVEIKVEEKYAIDKDANQEYRYVLIKKWGNEDEIGTVIMFNPSEATAIIYDKTVMNVENYLKVKGFNNIRILNLYAIKGKDSSIISSCNSEFEEINDKYIEKYIKDSKAIFLAWGYGKKDKSKAIENRIGKVEKVVKEYSIKNNIEVYGFVDDKGNECCHPQNMNISTWKHKAYKYQIYKEK